MRNKKDTNTGYPGKSAVMKHQGLEVKPNKSDAAPKAKPKKLVHGRKGGGRGANLTSGNKPKMKQTVGRPNHPQPKVPMKGIIGRTMC